MISLVNSALPGPIVGELARLQTEVSTAGTYREQIERGKTLFTRHNKSGDPAFKVVRTQLHTLGGATRRCVYCEDSLHDEIEHVAPKDLYPAMVFSWENYVYACGPCNGGSKQSKWRVFPFAGGGSVDVSRKRDTKLVSYLRIPPVAGDAVFINPRTEDPMEFLQLDLCGGTCFYTARLGIGARENERALYTREVLGLNTRPGLAQGRKNAFIHLRETLVAYDRDKIAGVQVTTSQQVQRIEAIQTTGHRTVWKEIVRQRQALGLNGVFTSSPEALTW